VRSGANDTLVLGRLENGLRHFHAAIERALSSPGIERARSDE
jgi:hypothetical protein